MFEKILEGSSHVGWSERDRALLQAVEELMTEREVSRDTWNDLSRFYSTEQMMDIVFTVGNYSMLGMAINSFDVMLDEGLKPIPMY